MIEKLAGAWQKVVIRHPAVEPDSSMGRPKRKMRSGSGSSIR